MKVITVEVKSKGEVIGTVEVDQFDNVAEATSSLGEDELTKLINSKLKADATNNVRVKHSQNTPLKQISRLTREARSGKLTNADAAKQISDLLSQLNPPAAA